MKVSFKLIALLLVVFTSCKSTKKTTDATTIEAISTKKIISNHIENNFNQKTIEAKMNAKYSDDKMSATVNIKLRMEKDKTIWLSATKLGFPLAKVLITPDKVSYYEKLQGTYFDGDFSLLSKFLGTELDFEKLQNILLGQAILDLKKEKYNSKIDQNMYELMPAKQHELFDILFLLNPTNFKINRQELKNSAKKQLFSVQYSGYKKINGVEFPESIDVRAIEDTKLMTLNIEYSEVEFNNELTFPFEIPNGYKEIKLK